MDSAEDFHLIYWAIFLSPSPEFKPCCFAGHVMNTPNEWKACTANRLSAKLSCARGLKMKRMNYLSLKVETCLLDLEVGLRQEVALSGFDTPIGRMQRRGPGVQL